MSHPDNSRLNDDNQQCSAENDQKASILPAGTLSINTEIGLLEYDQAEVERFLTTVFHVDLADDEEILCYHDYGQHNLAIREDALYQMLRRSRKPARLYYATATSRLQSGVLRNKLANFHRYHVLVLDDIGTKVPVEKILLEPTYIIESSPGNFQYGYALAEPLECLNEAQILVELIYGAKLSDEGGKLATKKVRLPGGINGKRGPNFGFRSKLHRLEPIYFTPQEIIDGLGLCGDWQTIVSDVVEARRRVKVAGTSLWSSIPLTQPALGGVVDTVAEWLYENGEVRNMSGEWLEIQCPWHHEHTDPTQDSAYYSPLGLGESEYRQKRGFFCHHSHPETTADFLAWVSREGGPDAPVFDPSAELVASCVYDTQSNTVYDIKKSRAPMPYANVQAFHFAHCRKLLIKGFAPGATKSRMYTTTPAELWAQHPARVVVDGTVYDPSTVARVVTRDNRLKLNTFCRPEYGRGTYDQAVVDVFLNYIKYLIPDRFEYQIFIKWLAAKFQNMAFRGWGMLMVAPQQRTGRGTLLNMLNALFYEENCAQIPMERLIERDNYNEWESKTLVFVGESEAMSMHGQKLYDAYNRLKDHIDTTIRQTIINNKYGMKETRMVYTSFILCANEALALAIDRNDQRIFVIRNNPVPASRAYFNEINNYINDRDENGQPKWCKDVARYLMHQKVDYNFMNGPAPSSEGKEEMLELFRSPLDIALDIIFAQMKVDYFPNSLFEDVLIQGGFVNRLELDQKFAGKIIRKEVSKRSVSLPKPVKFDGRAIRIRARFEAEELRRFKSGDETKRDRVTVQEHLARIDLDALKKAVSMGLDTEGL